MTEPGRTIVAMVSIKAYDDGHLEVNAPEDFLLTIHILAMGQKAMVESVLHRHKQDQSVIKRPGLHSVIALAKN